MFFRSLIKNKRMNILKKITLVLLLAVSSFSFSQSTEKIEYGNATIDANYCLVLDTETELQPFYAASASNLGWKDAKDAAKMCGYKSNNLITYSPDYENGRILIQIHADRTRELKDLNWWNEYLMTLCK